MKNAKTIIGVLTVSMTIVICSGFILYGNNEKAITAKVCKQEMKPVINLAISHGHCNLPVMGFVEQLEVNIPANEVEFGDINFYQHFEKEQLRKMKINFSVDANTLTTQVGDSYTGLVQSEEIFDGENQGKITFTTIDTYQLGNNWYQLRGTMSIKGVKQELMLRATPVYQKGTSILTCIVIDGEVNLFDFGIDYDKQAGEKAYRPKMKTMFINLVCELS